MYQWFQIMFRSVFERILDDKLYTLIPISIWYLYQYVNEIVVLFIDVSEIIFDIQAENET